MNYKPAIIVREKFRDTFVRKGNKWLNWYSNPKTEAIGNDLIIETTSEFDDIYISGVKYCGNKVS